MNILRVALIAATVGAGMVSTAVAGEQDDLTAIRGGLDTKGSLLVFPNVELRWDEGNAVIQDTFISLTNDYPEDVEIQIFYVNADPPLPAQGKEPAHPGWNSLDSRIVLTGNQPTYWSALTGQPATGGGLPPLTALDPGFPPGRPDPEGSSDRVLRAFVYVFAVNQDGEQIGWNHLSGRASVVNYQNYTTSEYEAVTHAAFGEVGTTVGTPGEIRLDGVEFTTAYDRLHLDFQAAGSSAFSGPRVVDSATDLTLQILPSDLRQESTGPRTTQAVFEIWNQNEVKFTGTEQCITCWDQTLLEDFPLPNSFSVLALGTDHGWARIDGRASFDCNDKAVTSVDAALVGVSTRMLVMDDGVHVGSSAVGLRGEGLDTTAVIQYDAVGKPPPFGHPPDDGPDTPSVGPSQVRMSTAEGSFLVFPNVELRWDDQFSLIQDTFITLQNHSIAPVRVLMWFLNGDPPLDADPPNPAEPGWVFLDNTIMLTGSQPTYWSALTGLPAGVSPFTALDPGFPPGRPAPDGSGDRVLRGTIYAWAVNEDGEEIKWNRLSGGVTSVNYATGATWEHRAFASAVVDPFATTGSPTGTPGVINLDGNEFAPAFSQHLLEFQASGGDAFSGPDTVIADTDLTLLPIDADFRQDNDGPVTTKADFDVWNMNEVKFSGARLCVTCWDQTLLSDYDIPNHFLVLFLQTVRGKARIDGVQSAECDIDFYPDDGELGCNPLDRVSVDAALLGVAATILVFDEGGHAKAGSTLIGMGTESATVRFDTLGKAPPFGDDCPEDLNGNGAVDFADILAIIAAWGPCCCPEDLDESGDVGFGDILRVIAAWGPC
ncbi:MAG: hypothetical protein ACYTGP_01415 [Planctomycetota bacterium]|jgi:hypothetical protein